MLNVKLQNSLAVCSSGIVVNHAQVMAADNTGDMDQALWVTQVDCGTALAISKRLVTPPGSVIAGQSITFEVTITNTGSVTATDVELTDYVTPISGARIIGVRDAAGVLPLGACINGGACNLGALGVAPNNVVKINVTVELDSDTRGQTVAQQACVEASNAARVCASANASILADANVVITKRELADPFVINDSGLPTSGLNVEKIADIGYYVIQRAELRPVGHPDGRSIFPPLTGLTITDLIACWPRRQQSANRARSFEQSVGLTCTAR